MRTLGSIAALYWRSTFCLQPIGDACTRKATIDALLLGCIPVLFHPCQKLQWPWHWGGWLDAATVYFENASAVDVVQELRRIPLKRILQMQHTIAMHAHCLHYHQPTIAREPARLLADSSSGSADLSRVGDADDAFEITLKGSWLVARHKQGEIPANELAARSSKLCKSVPLEQKSTSTRGRASRM